MQTYASLPRVSAPSLSPSPPAGRILQGATELGKGHFAAASLVRNIAGRRATSPFEA